MMIMKMELISRKTFSEYFKILLFFPFLLNLLISINETKDMSNKTLTMIILKANTAEFTLIKYY